MRKVVFILFFLGFLVSLNAQIEVADSLVGREKVEYIVDNFYEIYSLDFEEGIRLTDEAQGIAEANGWEYLEGMSYTCNGVAKYLRGLHDEAYASFLEADRIFIKIESDSGKAWLYNEMAVLYNRTGDTEKAYEMLDQAEEAAIRSNNLTQLGTNYGHRSTFLSREGRIEEARELSNKLLGIRLQENDSVGLGYVYLDLAEFAARDKDRVSALAYVDTAETIRNDINDIQGLAVVEVFRGEIEMEFQNYRAAATHFSRTIELAEPVGFADLIRYTYDQLQKAQLELGDYKGAYESLVLNRTFNDSLYNIEKAKTINELKEQYEAEKKDKEIAELSEKTAIQEAQNARNTLVIVLLVAVLILLGVGFVVYRKIEAAKMEAREKEREIEIRKSQTKAVLESQEKERQRFAADLHDGLGQLVSALSLNIQSLKREVSEDKPLELVQNSRDLLGDILTEIRNTAFNIMPPALTKAGLVPAIGDLLERLNRAGSISFTLEAPDEMQLEKTAEIAIYRVIQEWVSNIVRYGTATSVNIVLTYDSNKTLHFSISDDGDGFDKRTLEQSKGNGWRNINARLNVLGAEPILQTHPENKGSKLSSTIAIYHKNVA